MLEDAAADGTITVARFPRDHEFPEPPKDLVAEDGIPMDTPWHQYAMTLLIEVVTRRFHGRDDYFVGGNMFTSLHQDRWVVRLGDDDRARLAELGGVRFEVMPGREMKGYLVLPPELSQPESARPWVERALAFGRSLPAKQKKR